MKFKLPVEHIRCRLDWGQSGVARAMARGDILVVVDVLSFSTLTATAVHNGGLIYPCAIEDDRQALASRVKGEYTVHRREVPEKGRFSLSPATYEGIEPGTRVVVASPNGAACSRASRSLAYVFAGALVNASAVAAAVSDLLERTDVRVTVLACGERDKDGVAGEIRPAVEDYLGAGAVLSGLAFGKSPEARVCEASYRTCEGKLEEILWECESGRELREMGFGGDVTCAAVVDRFAVVPVLREGGFRAYNGKPAE